MDAKKYNNLKLGISIAEGILTFVLILGFVSFGYSKEFENYLRHYSENNYLLLLGFLFIVGGGLSVLFFPVKYYTEFYLEHKNNLSNQSFWGWIREDLKGLLVGAVIGIPILFLFYFMLDTFNELWWLPFAIAMFLISVVLAQILPIVILPIFYKILPIEDEELKERIISMSGAVGMKVENVFSFDMSKNTKKANAAFTGLGKTKRIILGDTLLSDYTKDEIASVIAHELGHYKHKHIVKNLIISTASSFLLFYSIAVLYNGSLGIFGFEKITEIAALPLLTLWSMLIGLLMNPITNSISRRFEYQADDYAVEVTGEKEIFAEALKKINEQNKGDEDPHPLVEWFFYSHPSIKNRLANINEK